MTLEARAKAIKDLEAILSHLAYRDYRQANPVRNGKRVYVKHRPYTLSPDTLEVLEMIKIASKEDITAEEEKMIKAFLLPHRMFKREYLINIDPRLR